MDRAIEIKIIHDDIRGKEKGKSSDVGWDLQEGKVVAWELSMSSPSGLILCGGQKKLAQLCFSAKKGADQTMKNR